MIRISNDFAIIMNCIWKRLNDRGKLWRHVYKSLLLLEYLVKNGSDQCVREARVHIIEVQTLQQFQHIDEKDHDVGLSGKNFSIAINAETFSCHVI
jgi:epsin